MRLDDTTESVLKRCAGIAPDSPLPEKLFNIAATAKRYADRVDSGIPFSAQLCGLIVALSGAGLADVPPPAEPVPAAPPEPPASETTAPPAEVPPAEPAPPASEGEGSGAGDGSGGVGDFDPTLVPPSTDPPVVPAAGPDFSADLGLVSNRNPFDDKPDGTLLMAKLDDGTEKPGKLDGCFGINRVKVAFDGDTQRYRVLPVESVRLA